MPMQIGIHAFYRENKGVDGEPPLAMTVARWCQTIKNKGGWYDNIGRSPADRPLRLDV